MLAASNPTDLNKKELYDQLAAQLVNYRDMLIQGVTPGTKGQIAAALFTHGLPVYSDMSGSLVILPDGKMVFYDPESLSIAEVENETWRITGVVSAAHDFPLRLLHPS